MEEEKEIMSRQRSTLVEETQKLALLREKNSQEIRKERQQFITMKSELEKMRMDLEKERELLGLHKQDSHSLSQSFLTEDLTEDPYELFQDDEEEDKYQLPSDEDDKITPDEEEDSMNEKDDKANHSLNDTLSESYQNDNKMNREELAASQDN